MKNLLEDIRDRIAPTVAGLNLPRKAEVSWIMEKAQIKPTDRILDIGCGSGYISSLFAEKALWVIGVDPDKKAIEKAQRRRFRKCEFRTGVAEALPIDSNSVDIVVGVCAMEHFSDHNRAVEEFARVLVKGGRVVMSVDSMTLSTIPEQYKKHHSHACHVTRYFHLNDVKSLFEPKGFTIQAYKYLIATEFGGMVYRGFGQIPFFPLRFLAQLSLYPLIHLTDVVFGRKDSGMKLCFLAQKQ